MTPRERATAWAHANLTSWSEWTYDTLEEAFKAAVAEERQWALDYAIWLSRRESSRHPQDRCSGIVALERLTAAIRARGGAE